MRTKKSSKQDVAEKPVVVAAPVVQPPPEEPKKRRGGFGRRKPPDPSLPPDPRSPPPRPETLEPARLSLQEQLGTTANVATGFGFGTESSKTYAQPSWRLYVFAKDPTDLKLPDVVDGFEVIKRANPTVSPIWGKYKHP